MLGGYLFTELFIVDTLNSSLDIQAIPNVLNFF